MQMTKEEVHILDQTARYAREKLAGDSSGHDWWHIHRVRSLSRELAVRENADLFIVELAALLHDIADWKFNEGDIGACSRHARQWLESLDVDERTIVRVTEIIDKLSFKGAGVVSIPDSLEGKIVQDADRLDAIGAIGIARTFAYGGKMNRSMHDPDDQPKMHQTFEEYKNNKGCTTNHFYEKLLLLKDRLNTESAKQAAEDRHRFMEEFLERFFKEWDGKL